MRHPVAMLIRRMLIIIFLVFFLPSLHAEDFYFDSAGAKIHYIVEGKGEPVLLLHGFTADVQTQWAASGVIKTLSSNYQVIAMDHRGHGQSDKPHDPRAYGMNLVEDPIRLLEHLKIRKAHIVGYSMGGMVTCAILGTHPERLLTAVIGAARWYPPEEDPMPAFRKQLADSLEQGKGIEPLIISLNPIGAPPPTPEQIEFINKMILSRNDVLALAALQRNFAPAPTKAQLLANKVPVLALVGELDPVKSALDRLDRYLPNLKTVVIPKANHITAFSHPDFIKNLKDFLAEHPGLAPGPR